MSLSVNAIPNNGKLPLQINARDEEIATKKKLLGECNKTLAEQNKRPDEITAESLETLRERREIEIVNGKKLQESTIYELQLKEKQNGIINNISQLNEKTNQAIKKKKENLNETSCTVWKLIVAIVIVALLITAMAYGIFNVPRP